MSAVDDAFYQHDIVRAMAKVTLQLATDLGANTQPHQDVLDASEGALRALAASGQKAPADLHDKTEAYLQSIRDGYEGIKTEANERLALAASVSVPIGVNVEMESLRATKAHEWVKAIDAAHGSRGGS